MQNEVRNTKIIPCNGRVFVASPVWDDNSDKPDGIAFELVTGWLVTYYDATFRDPATWANADPVLVDGSLGKNRESKCLVYETPNGWAYEFFSGAMAVSKSEALSIMESEGNKAIF